MLYQVNNCIGPHDLEECAMLNLLKSVGARNPPGASDRLFVAQRDIVQVRSAFLFVFLFNWISLVLRTLFLYFSKLWVTFFFQFFALKNVNGIDIYNMGEMDPMELGALIQVIILLIQVIIKTNRWKINLII
jgi:hypothetical protein